MKIDSIRGVLNYLKETSSATRKNTVDVAGKDVLASVQEGDVQGAVSLSSGIDEANAREEKVRKLKEQVQSGKYNPDSYAVAQAVARELFV